MECASAKRILVVDDDLHVRLFIKAVFETAGHTVVLARDGEEGLSKALENPPHLITLDLMMPREGGIRMYQQLKQKALLTQIPVIIVSAVTDDTFGHALTLINAGMAAPLKAPEAYISKPPTPDKLLQTATCLVPDIQGSNQ